MSETPIRNSIIFRMAMTGLLVSIVAVVLFGAYLLLFNPPHSFLREYIVATLLVVGLQFLLWTGAAVAGRHGVWKLLMICSSCATALGTAIWLKFVWSHRSMPYDQEELYTRVIVCTLLLGGAIIHTAVLWKLPGRAASLNTIRILTICCVWIITLFVVGAAIAEDFVEEIMDAIFVDMWMWLGVLILLFLCGGIGTLLAPILSLNTYRKQHKSEWVRRDVSMWLQCPRCRHEQELRQGYSRCAECRATIFIEFEEPRCECGYLLFELRSDTCPECGRAIEQFASVESGSGDAPPPDAPPPDLQST